MLGFMHLSGWKREEPKKYVYQKFPAEFHALHGVTPSYPLTSLKEPVKVWYGDIFL
jgi:hypothetical protein